MNPLLIGNINDIVIRFLGKYNFVYFHSLLLILYLVLSLLIIFFFLQFLVR